MKKPKATAVGRILRSKNGEPRKHQLIKVDESGKAKIVKNVTLP